MARPADLVFGVADHLVELSDPAYRACKRKNRGKQRGGNADRPLHDARVEVHVGVQLALDEIVVFQCNLFQGHCQLEQWVVLQPKGAQDLAACLLHQLGARVVVLVDPVAKAHQLDARCLVLDLADEFAHFADTAHSLDVFEHVEAGLVGATMRRSPQAGDTCGDGRERIGAGASAQTHSRGGRVLLMVRVQDEYAIQGAFNHGIDRVVLTRRGKHHVQEVAGVAEVVLRVHVGLAGTVLVGHRNQGRHLCDQADRRYLAVFRVVDVGAVMVEGRQRTYQAGHDRHRMGIAPETAQEELHLLVHHRMVRHTLREVGLRRNIRQVAIKQQVAGFEKVAVGRQLLDRIAPV